MKKVSVMMVLAAFLLTVIPYNANAAVDATIKLPDMDNMELQITKAVDKYYYGDLGYGQCYIIAVEAGGSVVFNKSFTMTNYAAGGTTYDVTAGQSVPIEDIDGFLVYSADNTVYLNTLSTANQYYTAEMLDKNLSELTVNTTESPSPETSPSPAQSPSPAASPSPSPAANESPSPTAEVSPSPAASPSPSPAAAAPTPVNGYFNSIDIKFPEKQGLKVTLTKANEKYAYGPFYFNPSQNSYTIFLGSGGTVKFSGDVTMTFVDAATYAVTEKTIKAGVATPITEINGGSLYFTTNTGDFVTFVSDSDPMYEPALEYATMNLVSLWAVPATGDKMMIAVWVIVAVAALACIYLITRRVRANRSR